MVEGRGGCRASGRTAACRSRAHTRRTCAPCAGSAATGAAGPGRCRAGAGSRCVVTLTLPKGATPALAGAAMRLHDNALRVLVAHVACRSGNVSGTDGGRGMQGVNAIKSPDTRRALVTPHISSERKATRMRYHLAHRTAATGLVPRRVPCSSAAVNKSLVHTSPARPLRCVDWWCLFVSGMPQGWCWADKDTESPDILQHAMGRVAEHRCHKLPRYSPQHTPAPPLFVTQISPPCSIIYFFFLKNWQIIFHKLQQDFPCTVCAPSARCLVSKGRSLRILNPRVPLRTSFHDFHASVRLRTHRPFLMPIRGACESAKPGNTYGQQHHRVGVSPNSDIFAFTPERGSEG